jgi:hypothetical protein
MWHVRRAGKGGNRVYVAGEFDLLALVALDIKRIAYLPPSEVRQTIHIRSPESEVQQGLNGSKGGKVFSQFSFEKAVSGINHGNR